MKSTNYNLRSMFDKTVTGVSLVCAVHCAILPIALVVLPGLVASSLSHELFHQILLVIVLPMSMISMILGCRKHQHWNVSVPVIAGISFLIVIALFGHDWFGQAGEKITTICANLLIAYGHVQNYRLCRKLRCQHD